ncbi:P-loop containing nucleoside triphosphate hydrolase protein, partial [Blastocladiella britannica]
MSGFMTLEEISGVDVVTEGTDRDGKILSFKAAASFKPAARKPTNVNAPMSGAEMQALGFVHVDDVLPDDHPADIKRLTREAQAAEAAAASDDDNGDDEADGRDEEPSLSTDDEAADGDEEWASASESDDDAGQEEADKVEQPTSATTAESVERPTVDSPEDLPDMSAWTDALPMLHPWLLKGLADQGFTSPTPIQAEAVPLVLARGKNIVGAAETGSGKTLAFGLPILQHIASSHMTHVSPVALILSPTRELALQIVDHLRAVIKPFSYTHRLNRVNIVPLVGGFSEEKQRRMVSSNPHILVATPGRLWDLIESGQLPAQAIQSIRFLVLDEADKMLEKGKFKELENLVGLFNKTKSTSEWDETTMRVHRDGDASHGAGVPSAAKPVLRQTLVFSATLPTSSASYTFKGRELTLKMLLSKLQLKSYETVDVTGGTKTTSNLIESRIDCTPDDKEVVLYYLLTRYPGRTLVFVNAISTIRRLVPILTTMRVPVYPLHAQMQQRQRLRNLERFAASDDGVLIASDVASRGLDIKNIDHVIHFQVPMTSDLYVHRSGRTARGAANTGLSIVLISPKELPAYRKICKQLGRDSIPAFPIEVQYLSEFRKRINLAKKIDVIQHTEAKTAHNRSWAQQAAEALEVDLSE